MKYWALRIKTKRNNEVVRNRIPRRSVASCGVMGSASKVTREGESGSS